MSSHENMARLNSEHKPTRKLISIVTITYNEEDNVRDCHETVKRLFSSELIGYEYEHIFGDNCSTDGTVPILKELAGADAHVRVILNARNFGSFRSLFNALLAPEAHLRGADRGGCRWFPDMADATPWLPALDHAMRNYKDESFVGQFLSPKLMRDFRLFAITDDEKQSDLVVSAIHDDSGYRAVREALAHQYDLGSREPNIQVWNVKRRGDRSLTLRHFQHNDRPLADEAREVLKHIARLWGFAVQLESVNARGEITKRFSVDAPPQG